MEENLFHIPSGQYYSNELYTKETKNILTHFHMLKVYMFKYYKILSSYDSDLSIG